VHDLGGDEDAHRWRAEGGVAHPAEIVVTSDALCASAALLEMWLEYVVDDARNAAPAPPGYYLVRAAGVSVRGIDRIDFEEFGQPVHCWVDDASGAPVWRVEVGGTDHGDFRAAEYDDDRDRIAAAAFDYLKRHSLLRIPPEPWQWSVLDDQGDEYWVRLTTPFDSGWNGHIGREIVAHHAGNGRERRVLWQEGLRPPKPGELRVMLSSHA